MFPFVYSDLYKLELENQIKGGIGNGYSTETAEREFISPDVTLQQINIPFKQRPNV